MIEVNNPQITKETTSKEKQAKVTLTTFINKKQNIMKKLFLWATALVMMASCSQDEITNPDGNKPTGGVSETHYLTVNIVAGNESTRASNEDEDGYEANGSEYGKYEDGTETENEVNSVRFYFFDENKDAAKVVKKGENDFINYYDWNPEDDTNLGSDHANSVEKILSAVIVINTKKGEGDKLPASIVAVINPTDAVKAEIGTLDELNKIATNFNVTNGFVMSNSIYAKDTDTEKPATFEEVSVAGHLYPDAEAAKANPVSIYVERVLAKVSVNVDPEATAITIGENEKIYSTTTTGETTLVEGEKVYVKFLGWNVTATADKSYLMKHIDPTWDENLFGAGNPWNWEGHRSFWAINPAEIKSQYGPFVETEDNKTNVAQAIKVGAHTYLHENAASTPFDYVVAPSQVIVAAQLVDEYGKSFEVAEYAGQRYKGKESVLKLIANAANIYKRTEEESTGNNGEPTYTYTKISFDEITFITASAADEEEEGTLSKSGRYFVYAVINEEVFDGEMPTFCLKVSGEGDNAKFKEYESIDDVNQNLHDLGHAKVWDTGYTYYYFNIRHLSNNPEAPGYYGVVRNHVYKNTIKAVSGLGTPVYDPDEVIIPETPEDDDTFIAAQIKILSWRIVNNSEIILGM